MKNNFYLDEIFLERNLILFGDDHNMNSGRKWLTDQIMSTSSEIKYLAIEYIETDQQQLIEDLDQKRLNAYLIEKYKEFPGFDPTSVINLIEKAKTKGIKVIGIEMPEKSFSDWKSKKSQKMRTKFISDQIIQLNKLGKGIILVGADHAEKKKRNLHGKVNNKGILSVIFVGGKSWSLDTGEYWIRKIELEAQKSGTEKELFAIKVKKEEFPCDWIIHFPQIEPLYG